MGPLVEATVGMNNLSTLEHLRARLNNMYLLINQRARWLEAIGTKTNGSLCSSCERGSQQ
jgi:hypothetical protein